LEERVGERRPFTGPDAPAPGALPVGCRGYTFWLLAENDGLLSLALSSKGGEGNGDIASEELDQEITL
jgi:hypothetical protein